MEISVYAPALTSHSGNLITSHRTSAEERGPRAFKVIGNEMPRASFVLTKRNVASRNEIGASHAKNVAQKGDAVQLNGITSTVHFDFNFGQGNARKLCHTRCLY